MDERKELHIVPPRRIEQAGWFALIMLGVFLVILTIGQIKGLAYIGSGVPATNTISVSGEGDVFAVPDTAEFSFSVDETAADVATAQSKATTEGNAVLDYLKGQGIADADIQTTDYSINPQYSYSQSACPASSGDTVVYCPPGKQVLTGYEVMQTVSVKVHDTSKAGDLLSGVGSKGATNVSGLSLTVSNQDELEAQARGKAIDDAESKAQALAKQLGVHLVRIVGYSEDGSGGPVPYYAKLDMAAGSTAAVAPSPEIPTGQNKITSDVTVTYEIE